MNQRIVWKLLSVLLLLGAASTCAHASWGAEPMGDRVRQSAVVAIVDSTAGQEGRGGVLTLREILKGDPKLAGQNVALRPDLWTGQAFVPRGEDGFAVLLAAGWEAGPIAVLELFVKPEEIQALRAMVRIVALPSERERLVELRERSGSPIFREQLVADLRDMREPASFSILLGLLKDGDEAEQTAAAAIVGFIGDVRGVPALIEALKSPRQSVALAAAGQLYTYFPGAPEVEATFREVLGSPSPDRLAKSYLARLPGAPQVPQSLYVELGEKIKAGDEAGARALLPLLLRQPGELRMAAVTSDDWLAGAVEESGQHEDVRRAIVALLEGEEARARENFALAAVVAKLGRALRHPDADRFLLGVLQLKADSWFDEPVRIAALALADRGGEARARAIELLSKRESWKSLAPLLAAFATPQDEAEALVRQLKADLKTDVANPASSWAIYRLGERREKSGVGVLAEWLRLRASVPEEAVVGALVAIGGDEVERAVRPLLGPEHREDTRRKALKVLVASHPAEVLPLLRRLARDADSGVRADAVQALASIGTVEDIALLAPLSDFWTGDRAIHQWINDALSHLRSRHGYGVNGPLQAPR